MQKGHRKKGKAEKEVEGAVTAPTEENDETRRQLKLGLQRLRLHFDDLCNGNEELQSSWLKLNAEVFQEAMTATQPDLMEAAVVLLERGINAMRRDYEDNVTQFKRVLDSIGTT